MVPRRVHLLGGYKVTDVAAGYRHSTMYLPVVRCEPPHPWIGGCAALMWMLILCSLLCVYYVLCVMYAVIVD